jgi:hypothetical protein
LTSPDSSKYIIAGKEFFENMHLIRKKKTRGIRIEQLNSIAPHNENNYNSFALYNIVKRSFFMEHVIINYPKSRAVLIDGEETGMTNTILRVEEGTHTFRMEGPKDYKPSFRRVMVTGTSPIKPKEVTLAKRI